jgi:hypothetical protein
VLERLEDGTDVVPVSPTFFAQPREPIPSSGAALRYCCKRRGWAYPGGVRAYSALDRGPEQQ